MKTFSLFERSCDAREIPHILVRIESVGQVLRTQDPRIVRQASTLVRSRIRINQLACGRNGNVSRIELENLRILYKMKNMRVRPTELPFAVLFP